MWRIVVITSVVIALAGFVKCGISWTQPVDGNGNCGILTEGDGSLLWSLSQGFVTATGTGTFTYTKETQTPARPVMLVESTSGYISTKENIDFDNIQSISFEVVATVDDHGTQTSFTATCTIPVVAYNRHAPVFSPSSLTVNVADELTDSSTITDTFTATDADASITNNQLTYAIMGGNTGDDLAIDPKSGAVTVAKGNTLSAARTPHYTLTITAKDGGTNPMARTGTGSLTVCVGCLVRNGAAVLHVGWLGLVVAMMMVVVMM